jgi:hypothetical protein
MKKILLMAALLTFSTDFAGVVRAADDAVKPCPVNSSPPPTAVMAGVEKAPDFIDLACETLKTLGTEHLQLTAAVKRLNDDAAGVDGKLQQLHCELGSLTASLRCLHAGVARGCYPFCVNGASVANRCVAERLTGTMLARSKAIQGAIQLLESQLTAGQHETARMTGELDTLEARIALVPYQTSRIAARSLPQESDAMLVTLQAMLPAESPEIQELRIRVAEFLASPASETQTAEQPATPAGTVK